MVNSRQWHLTQRVFPPALLLSFSALNFNKRWVHPQRRAVSGCCHQYQGVQKKGWGMCHGFYLGSSVFTQYVALPEVWLISTRVTPPQTSRQFYIET